MQDFGVEDPAGKLALVTVAAAAAYRLWLRLRHDNRTDRAEAREHAAEGDVIDVLREEVERILGRVRALEDELKDERVARYAAERRGAELQMRVETLERRLRDLGHDP
jgi:polyhydroxyalkanoate synthesis regulator phasin